MEVRRKICGEIQGRRSKNVGKERKEVNLSGGWRENRAKEEGLGAKEKKMEE